MWERVEELLSTEAAKTPPVPQHPRYLSHGDPPVQSNIYIYNTIPSTLPLGRYP